MKKNSSNEIKIVQMKKKCSNGHQNSSNGQKNYV